MNLTKRFWTALILLTLLFLVLQYASRTVMFLVLQAVVVAALIEFYNLARRRKLQPKTGPGIFLAVLLGASFYLPGLSLEIALFFGLAGVGLYFLIEARTLEAAVRVTESMALTVFGAVYIGFTLNFLMRIRDEYGPAHLYFLLAVIFLGDTGAFFIGKWLGRHRMTPIASPNKTWEGAVGGLLFAGLGAWAAQAILLPAVTPAEAVAAGLAVSIAAQIGDPLESLFKRAAGVKDSSNALPGHGGFLDRLDSLLFAVPFFYFFVRIVWKTAG